VHPKIDHETLSENISFPDDRIAIQRGPEECIT